MTGVNAYLLVADPSYLRESLAAYYPFVDRIILSYDRSATSWTGTPLPLSQCLRIIEEVDIEGKCVHDPGDFARSGHQPMANETFQRGIALQSASRGADWVVQIDTDEVLSDATVFFEMLAHADEAGAAGLDYPSRWLYARSGPGRYLEVSSRFWRAAASYPGPLAVRADARLQHARQIDGGLFRVDFAARNTDRWRPKDAPVHAVIDVEQAVLHFAWVRHPDAMRRKFAWSGHAPSLRDPKHYERWMFATRHPVLVAAATPLRGGDSRWLRRVRVAEPPGGAPIELQYDEASDRGSRP